MNRKINATGMIFGRLTVIRRIESQPRRWECQCSCGNSTIVRWGDLQQGRTVSCGCFHRERVSALFTKHGFSGGGRTIAHPLYGTWKTMWTRCTNPNRVQWRDYGGRGITVCDRWHDFTAFLDDMGPRPTSAHTLDRINNDGNYEPGNVRWATRKEQGRNARPGWLKRQRDGLGRFA